MKGERFEMRVDAGLLERVRLALGPGESRASFVTAAIEAALDDRPSGPAFDRFVAASKETWDQPSSGVARLDVMDGEARRLAALATATKVRADPRVAPQVVQGDVLLEHLAQCDCPQCLGA